MQVMDLCGFAAAKLGVQGAFIMFTSLYYLSLKNLQWFLMKIHLYALWISKVFCLIGFMLFYVNFIWFLLNWTVKARVLFWSDFFFYLSMQLPEHLAFHGSGASCKCHLILTLLMDPVRDIRAWKVIACVHCHCISWQVTVGHHLMTFGPYNKKIKKRVCTWRHYYLWSDL